MEFPGKNSDMMGWSQWNSLRECVRRSRMIPLLMTQTGLRDVGSDSIIVDTVLDKLFYSSTILGEGLKSVGIILLLLEKLYL